MSNGTSNCGWNRPRADQPKKKDRMKMPSSLHGIVAGTVIVCALGALFLWMFSSGDDTPAPAQSTEHKAQSTKPAPKPAKSVKKEETRKDRVRRVRAELNDQVKEFVKKSPGTNKIEWALPPLDPKDPDNALRTGVVQELGSLLSIEPGEPVPPFPYSFLIEDAQKEAGVDPSKISNGNKSFLDSLKKWKIAMKETDDAHRKEHKSNLVDAQIGLLNGMKEGVSVNDSIRAAYEFRKNAYEVRSTIIKTFVEIASEEGADQSLVVKQIHDMNKRLAEEGIKAIAVENVMPDYEGPDEPDVAGEPGNEEE